MKKILLVCSAGMSTSFLVTKMQKASEEKGIETKIWAVAEIEASENIKEADVILLGPQVKHLLKRIQEEAGDKPVATIDMRLYGTMNGEKVLEEALSLLK